MRNRSGPVVAFALAASTAGAAPLVIPHNGLLLDAADVPVTAPAVRVQFGIHATATGGSALWSSQTCTVSVRTGRFATTLGDACPGAAPLDESVVPPGTPRWIELTVEGVTLQPRLQMSSVPSASVALRSLDTEALRTKLSSVGMLNTADNPVDWSQLKNVPADVAAGGNYSAGGGLQLVGKQFSVASGGIGTSQLAVGAVTADRLSDGAATSAKIADAAILTTKIAAGAVGTVHLADGSVTGAKIAAGAVGTNHLVDGSITGAKIAAGTIAADRLAGGIPLTATTGALDASRLTGSLPSGMVPTGTRMERSATRATCAASDLGTLYLNSDDDQVYVCGASGWKKVSQRPGTLRWADTSWAIGNVYATPVSRTLTLHNDGDMGVGGLQITLPANLIQQSTTCGSNLAGASTCTVSVATVHPGGSTSITGDLVASGGGTASSLPVTGQFQPLASCKAIKAAKPTAATGVHSIDSDGSGTGAPYDVFCDMTTEGGGWTLLMNLASRDTAVHDYHDTNFWLTDSVEGQVGLSSGHKSKAFSQLKGTELMFLLHDAGASVKGYATYDLGPAYTSNTLLTTFGAGNDLTITGTRKTASGASGAPRNPDRPQSLNGDLFVDRTEPVVINKQSGWSACVNRNRIATTLSNSDYAHTLAGIGGHHSQGCSSHEAYYETSPIYAYCDGRVTYGNGANSISTSFSANSGVGNYIDVRSSNGVFTSGCRNGSHVFLPIDTAILIR